jgi:glyoxylase-like metal-dependent hydrolase (beta-lactamase superfamily II)
MSDDPVGNLPAESENYQVTIVRYGTRTTSRSEVYLNYPLYGADDGPIGMDYFFWIVRNHARTIVVDTGFSPAGGAKRKRTLLADVPALLGRFGADPRTDPTVVLTHAHYDHAGNLNLFPRSRVVMSRKEFDFWSGAHGGKPLFSHSVEADELEHLRVVEKEGRLELFDDSIVVAPGVEVLELGGHTPGQSVVKVATAEGVVLLASDAVHYYEELERDMLFTSVADLVEMYDGFDTIREMERRGEIGHLVSGHDPATLARFTPGTGDFGELTATIGQFDG